MYINRQPTDRNNNQTAKIYDCQFCCVSGKVYNTSRVYTRRIQVVVVTQANQVCFDRDFDSQHSAYIKLFSLLVFKFQNMPRKLTLEV